MSENRSAEHHQPPETERAFATDTSRQRLVVRVEIARNGNVATRLHITYPEFLALGAPHDRRRLECRDPVLL